MKITGKHIRSISKILALTKGKDVIRLGYKLKSSDSDKILSLGFFKPFTESGYIVPSPVSKLTLRNANGHMVTRKDLPKETREIEYYSSNKDWHGGYHEGVRFKEILAYPKEFISPNLEEFVIKEIEGDEFFVSNGIDISFDKDRLKFVANLMLELFGEFEIITEDFSTTSNCKHKNVSWDILPPGDYPWNKISEIVSKGMSLKNESNKKLVLKRMAFLHKFNPDFVATGRAGFSGYIVFGFEEQKVYVLESAYLDNATYIFDDNWEELSKLSKNELIKSSLMKERLIHNKAWNINLLKMLGNIE